MPKTKTCGHCQFSVPSDAKVCGHCGARFVKYRDSSFGGRIAGAISGVIAGGILGGIAGTFANDASGWAIIGACIMGVFGFIRGYHGESTRR